MYIISNISAAHILISRVLMCFITGFKYCNHWVTYILFLRRLTDRDRAHYCGYELLWIAFSAQLVKWVDWEAKHSAQLSLRPHSDLTLASLFSIRSFTVFQSITQSQSHYWTTTSSPMHVFHPLDHFSLRFSQLCHSFSRLRLISTNLVSTALIMAKHLTEANRQIDNSLKSLRLLLFLEFHRIISLREISVEFAIT